LKRFAGIAVALGVVGLISALALWVLPADAFVFEPGNAKPLGERVQVEGARPEGEGDIYYVDVLVRRTSRLEDLFPFLLPDDSTVVPEVEVLPAGTTEAERDRQTAADMQRSELVASAVAPKGALVIGIASDVPAAGKVKAGDVIVAVDGVQVRTPDELRSEIGKRKPGAPVALTVLRDDKRIDVQTRTVASPVDPSRPIIGIRVDQEADIDLPIDIDIDLGRVGGPSAGLAFALEIARMLGRDVTKGCRVAATGELALDGSVLSVGGLKQKTVGARETGVDLFLVPAGENAADARDHAEDLEIVPVESFQQAFRELATSARKC
jgi:PDZ domain-containing protein